MLTRGLLCPQFGGGRTPDELDEGLSMTALLSPPGPTVVIKKRRSLDLATLQAIRHESGALTEPYRHESANEPRESRVFRKETTVGFGEPAASALVAAQTEPNVVLSVPVSSEAVSTSGGGEHAALETVPLTESYATPVAQRRPRNPLRKPTLVQHVVFDRQGEVVESTDAAHLAEMVVLEQARERPRAPPGWAKAFVEELGLLMSAESDRQKLVRDLRTLKAKVDGLVKGQRATEALTQLTTELFR